MKNILLIHGAWHASWCWDIIVKQLKQRNFAVEAIDLPGHSTNDKPPFHNIKLQDYTNHLISIIEKQKKQFILVGHSMAGVVISQVAEKIPKYIDRLIYLCAFVPNFQGSLSEEEQKFAISNIRNECIIDLNQYRIIMSHSNRLKEIFYGDCTEEQFEYAKMKLQDQPLFPFGDKVSLSNECFGSVKKSYIECTKDQAILIEDQRRMRSDITDVVSLESDHSPFLSHPNALCEAIIKLI